MKDFSNRIEIARDDITKLNVDVVVNAANSSLMGGGGVDGAIHRAGGPAILDECKAIIAKQGSCPVGEVVITTGGRLPAKFVIHAVGPVWVGGARNESQKLASCYRKSLALAVKRSCKLLPSPISAQESMVILKTKPLKLQ